MGLGVKVLTCGLLQLKEIIVGSFSILRLKRGMCSQLEKFLLAAHTFVLKRLEEHLIFVGGDLGNGTLDIFMALLMIWVSSFLVIYHRLTLNTRLL